MAFVSHRNAEWSGGRKAEQGHGEKQSPSNTRLNKKVSSMFALYYFCYQNSLYQ